MRLAFLFFLATAGCAQFLRFGSATDTDRLPAIEALVTDAAGHIPPDLTAADFALQDRKPLKITSCTYVDMSKRRSIAVVVDDLGLTDEAIGRVRAALEKFVETDLEPDDRLAIVRSGSGNGELEQLTGDKEAMRKAIARLYYNPRQVIAATESARANAFSTGALGSVRQAMAGLRRFPGRKSVVLISLGLDQQPAPDLETLAMDARRDQVAVYGIDAAPAGTASVTINQFSGKGIAALAKRSGGELLDGGAALDRVLAGALSGPNGYYLLRYRRPDDWDAPQLTVARPGLQLLTVRLFDSMSESSQYSSDSLLGAPRVGDNNLVRAMSDPFSTGRIRTRLTPLFYNGQQGSTVAAEIYVDVHDLTFRQGLDGMYRGGGSLLVAAFGAGATSLAHSEKRFDLSWTPAQHEAGLRAGIVVVVNLAVRPNMLRPRDPGGNAGAVRSAMLQIYSVVSDDNSGKMGSAHEWMEAPDVNDGRLALSGIELHGPEDWEHTERILLEEPEETPAVRIFRSHTPIGYSFELYNATRVTGQPGTVDLGLEFYREGRLETMTPPVGVTLPAEGDPRRASMSGRLKLPADMQPGRYVVRFLVSDQLAAGPPRPASQFVDFELRP